MKSFISWIGGKNYLKKAITERMPEKFDRMDNTSKLEKYTLTKYQNTEIQI